MTEKKLMVEFLKKSILFCDTDDAALKTIASRLERVEFQKGEPIVLENEPSDHVYFLYSGKAEVLKNIPELNRMTRLAILQPGDQFSEFSVLNRSAKSASVFALEDCVLYRMSGEKFLEALRTTPQVAKSLVLHIARMTQHFQCSRLNIDYLQPDRVELHPQIPQILPQAIWRRFSVLPIRFEHQSLFVAMQNPQQPEFFNLIRKQHPTLQVYVSLIGHMDYDLLEKELIAGYSQTVTPPRSNISIPLQGTPAEWLPKLSLFRDIPNDWFLNLAENLTQEQFAAGQSIYVRGQSSEKIYLVQSGLVTFSVAITNSDGLNLGSVYVGAAKPGDHFAEVSILNGSQHILSAKAATDSVVYSLPKEIFNRLLETPFLSVALARDLAKQFQSISSTSLPYFDPSQGVQLQKLSQILPQSIMRQYEILPLRLKDDELTIGLTNIESETIYSVIGRYLQNYRVKLEIITGSDFKHWLGQIENTTPNGDSRPGSTPDHRTQKKAQTTDAVAALNAMLELGHKERASDLHFEPQSDGYVVRYRVDGVLHEGSEKFEKQLGAEVLNRMKILSQLDVTNHFTPQDGQLKFQVDGMATFARISTLPTKRGEKAALRLIRPKNSVPPLTALAPDRRIVNLLRSVVGARQGVFLVTGPTGSGKSTTLYSLLHELNHVGLNIVTLENPVEMEIAGVNQVEINETVGLTFPVALKSALRQDPNVILIGEIRDTDSAKIAFHAASTGHLVLSTLHTNDSLNVIPRLIELGISNSLLASTLVGASAQRLLRKICDRCRDVRPLTNHEIEILKSELRLTRLPTEMAYGKGCIHCGHTGYYGRMAVIEAWTKNRAIENLLSDRNDMDRLTALLRAGGFETLRQFALKMACHGLTTFEEVFRVVGGSLVESDDISQIEMTKSAV